MAIDRLLHFMTQPPFFSVGALTILHGKGAFHTLTSSMHGAMAWSLPQSVAACPRCSPPTRICIEVMARCP